MRPKKEDHLKRSIQLKVYVTIDEKNKIMAHYEKEHFPTFSDFVRFHLMKKREVKIIEVGNDFRELFKGLDFELAKLGNNMNQVAHRLNSYNTYMLDDIDKEIFKASFELLKFCREALEKHLKVLNLK